MVTKILKIRVKFYGKYTANDANIGKRTVELNENDSEWSIYMLESHCQSLCKEHFSWIYTDAITSLALLSLNTTVASTVRMSSVMSSSLRSGNSFSKSGHCVLGSDC